EELRAVDRVKHAGPAQLVGAALVLHQAMDGDQVAQVGLLRVADLLHAQANQEVGEALGFAGHRSLSAALLSGPSPGPATAYYRPRARLRRGAPCSARGGPNMSDPQPARTPEPPYYAVVFTSLRQAGDEDGYAQTAERMLDLAASMPGFLGVESARGADGL